MELIAYILYILASKSILLLIVSIFLTIGGFSFVSVWVVAAIRTKPPDGQKRSLRGKILRVVIPVVLVGAFAVIVGILVFSIVNIIRPHLIDGILINEHGQKADAKVLSVEGTNNLMNEQPVMRHNIIFKTAEGKNIETYFETWDFNIYPSANTVIYPKTGQAFRVAYLPSFPTAFIILTEEDSDYSRGKECGKLLAEVNEARIKSEFDRTDIKYKEELDTAIKTAADANCLAGTVEIKPVDQKQMPVRTQ